MMLRAVLVAAVVSLALANTGPPWLLAAWNIRKFGKATMGKIGVPDVITEVMRNYHLMVIQEVQDSNNVAIPALLNKLNNGLPSNDQFVYKMSDQKTDPTGKKMERYAVFYRPSHIRVVESITYNGPPNKFTYPPYELVLRVGQGNSTYKFGMIVLHTKPALAVQEMDNLADEAREFMFTKNLPGVLIGGDLNVEKNKKGHRLTAPDFKWLIGDDINTSINGFSAPGDIRAYDRMIVLGDDLFHRITDAQAYCYDTDPNFTWPIPFSPSGYSCVPRNDKFRLVMHVSDHYPVAVQMN